MANNTNNNIKTLVDNITRSFSNDEVINLFYCVGLKSFTKNITDIDLSFFSNFDDSIFSNPILIGSFEVEEGNICVLSIKTNKELNEKSGKKKQYDIAKSYLKIANEYAGGFFIFYDENSNFRFSFVYDIPIGGGKRIWSNFRRYTYFVSKDFTNRTFIEQFSSANFKSLNGIIDAFSVEKVTKEFYQQIANWYFWAQNEVKFPDDLNEGQEKANQKGLIRLITRLIFIWFLKEKGVVNKDLFDLDKINEIIDFKDSTGSTYYKAILQNLFFATLNTFMKKDDNNSRIFVEDAQKFGFISDGYFQQGYYRYSRFIKDKEKFLKLFENIPFLNGGLFENLDKEEIDEKGQKKVIRIDCFSNNPNNENKLKVPDYLFFIEEIEVDLSKFLAENNNNKGNKKIFKTLKGIFNIFKSYNFTIDENSPVDQEIALDPELLGKVFENLLACYTPETSTTARKSTGSFYTPREIVDYMVDESLTNYFLIKLNKENDDDFREKIKKLLSYDNEEIQFNEEEKKKLINLVEECKIIDPACGSGAFLMSILHKLVLILHKIDPDNKIWLEKILKNLPTEIRKEEEENLKNKPLDYIRKLGILRNCIFGVDIQEIAIQITKLRFFISLIVDQNIDDSKFNRDIRPLPNLEMNFVAADSLIKLSNNDVVLSDPDLDRLEDELNKIRSEFFYANSRKEKRKLEKKEKKIKEKINNFLTKSLSTDSLQKLIEWNPYDQTKSATWFDPEWMFGVKDGFDIVIGNPPYIQLQSNSGRLAEKYKNENYKTFNRMGDIYCLFYERGLEILKKNGVLCYITSNKWMRAGYGERLREFFTEYDPQILIDLGPDVFENATVDTNILMIKKNKASSKRLKALTLEKNNETNIDIEKQIKNNSVFLEKLDKNAWFIGSSAEIRLKEKIERIGKPLKDWDVKIYRGILTGLNDAFIITTEKRNEILKNCKDDEERKRTEAIIKPILRGRDIKRYYYEWAGLWVIFIPWHFPLHEYNSIQGASEKAEIEFKKLYSSVYNYLLEFKDVLSKRNKDETGIRYEWYSLQRCAATYYSEFEKEKVVYSEIVREPQFYFDNESFYIEATGFLMTGKDVKYLCGLLNSNPITYFFKKWYAGGGLGEDGYRYKKAFLENLPIPEINQDNKINVKSLEEIVDYILSAKRQNKNADTSKLEKEIDYLVYKLYDLTEEEIRIVEGGR